MLTCPFAIEEPSVTVWLAVGPREKLTGVFATPEQYGLF
jgi:hypothetical protein